MYVPGIVLRTLHVLIHINDTGAVAIPILQMKKLRHGEVKYLAPGHIASKCQSQDSNPGSLVRGLHSYPRVLWPHVYINSVLFLH